MASPRAEKLPARAQTCRRRRFCFERASPPLVSSLNADARIKVGERRGADDRRLLRNLDRVKELVTERGGGVLFSQGAHQVDIVRLLGGGRVASVRALTGAWDPVRPSEGAYAALLTFENGAFATIAYSESAWSSRPR